MSKVFISYSHDSQEHRDKVLALSQRLRQDGIETLLDQYVNGSPPQGWPRWMLDEIEKADFVLVICTETYYRRFRGREQPDKGKGATWEGALITQEIYDSSTRTGKFIPVFLSAPTETWIPEPLRSQTYYALTSQSAYDGLYDHLLAQSGVEPAEIGSPKRKPRRKGETLTFDEPAPTPQTLQEPKETWAAPHPIQQMAPQHKPAPAANQPASIPSPRAPTATLMEILVGHWQVQIRPPFAPAAMGQLQLDLFPNNLFRWQLTSPMGMTGVEGQWQVNLAQNQIGLQGMQSDGFQVVPYSVIVQVSAFDRQQIHGVTSGGEQVLWQRLD